MQKTDDQKTKRNGITLAGLSPKKTCSTSEFQLYEPIMFLTFN